MENDTTLTSINPWTIIRSTPNIVIKVEPEGAYRWINTYDTLTQCKIILLVPYLPSHNTLCQWIAPSFFRTTSCIFLLCSSVKLFSHTLSRCSGLTFRDGRCWRINARTIWANARLPPFMPTSVGEVDGRQLSLKQSPLVSSIIMRCIPSNLLAQFTTSPESRNGMFSLALPISPDKNMVSSTRWPTDGRTPVRRKFLPCCARLQWAENLSLMKLVSSQSSTADWDGPGNGKPVANVGGGAGLLIGEVVAYDLNRFLFYEQMGAWMGRERIPWWQYNESGRMNHPSVGFGI